MEKISTFENYAQWPYSVRLTFQLLLIILIGFLIRTCSPIIVPLYFSMLLSILLLPLVNLLERYRIPRAAAALISVLFALILVVGLLFFLSSQIAAFLHDIPAIKMHLTEHYHSLQSYVEHRFNIDSSQQADIVNSATENIHDSGMSYLKQTVFTVTAAVAFLILTVIYAFLILFYRHLLRAFILALFAQKHNQHVNDVITGSRGVIKNYMLGLIIEMAIISTCNVIVLLMVGIKYAIFLGIFTGILNIMPYIGIYTGTLFTILVTLTTSASMSQVSWILIGLLAIHFCDANFLMPRIVGSRVRINALSTIVGVVIGGFLIGIPGIFFATPTIAILKIVFDRIDSMKPWGLLLGDQQVLPQKKLLIKKA